MSEPESPSPAEPALSRRDKKQLLQKMYSLPHWIAIIRLFAYQTMTMEKTRLAIKPISEEFGKDKTAEACEVLVEIVPGKDPAARLKSHIRRMAFQILGPEESSAPARIESPAPEPQPEKARKQSVKREQPDANKAIKQPRHLVLNRYQAWLD